MHLFGDGDADRDRAATAEATAASIAEIDAGRRRGVVASRRAVPADDDGARCRGSGRDAVDGTVERLARLTLAPAAHRLFLELANGVGPRTRRPVVPEPVHARPRREPGTTFSGLPPWQAGTAAVFCFTTGGHGRTFGRPIGGSRAFVDSLVACIRSAGGTVDTGCRVDRIERQAAGWSVRCAGGRAVRTRAVVSAIPPQETLLGLVHPASLVPRRVRARLERVEVLVGNLSQLTLAAALSRVPQVSLEPGLVSSTLWLQQDPDSCTEAPVAAAAGRLPERLGTLLTFPSLMDPTLAGDAETPGAMAATMWANSFVGAELAGGWDAQRGSRRRPRVGDHRSVRRRRARPRPARGAHGSAGPAGPDGAASPGNHVAPTLHQSLRGRPVAGLGGYRTPLPDLYLTGAGTHPGGGVSGASGRAAAQRVITDLHGGRSASALRALGRQAQRGCLGLVGSSRTRRGSWAWLATAES